MTDDEVLVELNKIKISVIELVEKSSDDKTIKMAGVLAAAIEISIKYLGREAAWMFVMTAVTSHSLFKDLTEELVSSVFGGKKEEAN